MVGAACEIKRDITAQTIEKHINLLYSRTANYQLLTTHLYKKTLFLTLRVFSATGGIEKVCRLVGKALYELGLQYGGITEVYSMYGKPDSADGNKYFPQLLFKGFSDNKIGFVLKSIAAGRRSDVVIMSHINLLVVGYLVKFFKPSVKMMLIAHGIEVWKPLPGWKKYMLRKCDLILPVSHFTKDRMVELHGLPGDKFSVFNNCLEPFLEKPLTGRKSPALLERYGLVKSNRILLTVSRMADSEQYKGYDKVLTALPELIKGYPDLRYMLVGKYDTNEKKRLDRVIDGLGLHDVVIFTGFVQDEEMAAHFNLGDIFIMPSEKEGFGIVFIEAMFYGLPVIAGNKDGSTDALWNGELGTLIDPDNNDEIVSAIKNMLNYPERYIPSEDKLHERFSYTWYKRKLKNCLERVDLKVGSG